MKYLRRFNESVDEKMEWTKHFKILSIKYDDWKILKPGHIEFDECVKDCVENTYTKDPIEINSVQRISDGEIFTLGDMVSSILSTNTKDNHISKYGRITKIWPSYKQMRAIILGGNGTIGLSLNNLSNKNKNAY